MTETEITNVQQIKSVYEHFNSDHESLLTDDSLFITYDENTEETERKIQATQVVDCVVVAMWGKTKEGRKFISLIHKSSPSTVEKLMKDFATEIKDAELSYLVIPGPESNKKAIARTKEECQRIFAKDEAQADVEANLRIEKHERMYDKSSVVITGLPNGEVSILTVCPNPEEIREKMANNNDLITAMVRNNQ